MIDPYLISIDRRVDKRGLLSFLEFNSLPCQVRRIFMISVNDVKTTRGGHAHKTCWQVFIPCDSEITVDTKNSVSSRIFKLGQGDGLVVPPKNWVEIHFLKPNASTLVLASHAYDPEDYIFSKESALSE